MIYKLVAIKWGINNEKLARCVYIEYMKKQGHKGVVVEDCGFIVGIHEGYLGASPDGRIHDPSSDQPSDILEIKCPYTNRAQTPKPEEVGHVHTPLIVITYFCLEFHTSLNGCNIKPANLGVQWGSVDH